ncbi:MAG: hypothetical protein GVY19_11990 [Bacteroidetes bacterium]|jgi:effector-binding domain-containing protein|nr:hypothetical protein [Bacteroidota bacterium]
MKPNQFKKISLCAILAISFVFNLSLNAIEPGEIEVKDMDGMKAVILQATVPSQQIGQKMPEMFGKLYGYLGQHQIQPAGPAFSVYFSYDPEGDTKMAVGAPVGSKVKTEGEFKYREFPKAKAVSTLYKGPYEEMGPVYDELMAYLDKNELSSTGQAWEVYITNPEEVKDPDEYETMIYFTIK